MVGLTYTLNYKRIPLKEVKKYLKESTYDNFWFRGDNKEQEFIRPIKGYGIFRQSVLMGLIILEDWTKFYEAHIFSNTSIRGIKLIKLLKDFLSKKIKTYKMLVGRIKKNRKDVMRLAKWLKFRQFMVDDEYYYVGVDYESIRFI